MNIVRLPALAVSLFCLTLALGAEAPNPVSKAGAALLKADILGVYAHPDDETGSAATLASYALGRHLSVATVYCTRGDGGGNMVGTQAGPALALLREAELRDGLGLLGIRRCYFLDRADFGYTESSIITLEKWDHREAVRQLVRLIRALRPEVVVTLNPSPTPGQHGHHQAAGMLALEAVDLAADENWFPEQLTKEGLHVWKTRKIYFDGPAGTGATIDVSHPLPDGRTPAQVAALALANHRSQGFGGFAGALARRQSQSFTLAKSVVPFATNETDLLRGLPVAGDIVPRVLAAGDGVVAAGIQLRFVSRPAVEWYDQWVKGQRIEHVAQRFATDLPVVVDEVNEVFFNVTNPTTNAVNTTVRITPPAGWQVNYTEAGIRISPSRVNKLRVLVTPPAGRQADADITATLVVNGVELSSTIRLHPVPAVFVPWVEVPLAISAGADDSRWAALPAEVIQHTNTWQGKAAGAADCSGEFRLAHNGTNLFVEVRVHDDVVVSNLAADDIRAHWRSDSVELCLDPAAGAGHTFGSYKLGLVPFDSTGKVRAARDADANPGPVEETAPGTRLASWKTPDGYAIRVSIPFSEIKFDPLKDATPVDLKSLGLNVLIYDGDKTGAAPGENINKTRLAWSPRSGVQGRPEDWGRANFSLKP